MGSEQAVTTVFLCKKWQKNIREAPIYFNMILVYPHKKHTWWLLTGTASYFYFVVNLGLLSQNKEMVVKLQFFCNILQRKATLLIPSLLLVTPAFGMA